MSKVTLAFGSFIVGACSAFLVLSIPHTSTRVQAGRSVPSPGVFMPGAEPVVPPATNRFVGGTIGGTAQALDGIICERCSIVAPVLTYAGGGFSCVDCNMPRGATITLKGAALT